MNKTKCYWKTQSKTGAKRKTYLNSWNKKNSKNHGDFPGGPVVKTSPSNTGSEGSIPGRGTKIPHAAGCSQKVKEKKIPKINIQI